jgi:hypothetical protein
MYQSLCLTGSKYGLNHLNETDTLQYNYKLFLFPVSQSLLRDKRGQYNKLYDLLEVQPVVKATLCVQLHAQQRYHFQHLQRLLYCDEIHQKIWVLYIQELLIPVIRIILDMLLLHIG